MKKIFYIHLLLLFLSSAQLYAQETRVYDWVARNAGTAVMWDGTSLQLWGFKVGLGGNVNIPGPVLMVNEGDSVIINVINQSPMPHTIHLHGVDVNQANDGVPETSFEIPGIMGTGSYRFVTDQAGTYIYHCHYESVIHTQLGMYGAIVVKAAEGKNEAWTGGPAYDKDYTWTMAEMDKDWHDNPPENGEISWYAPDYYLVNGKSKQQLNDTTVSISADPGEQVYLRLINIGYGINEIVFPNGFNATILSTDGRPLPVSERNDTVRVYPGERYGVMLDFNASETDSIKVNYYNMYDDVAEFTNMVPLNAEAPVELPSITLNQIDDFQEGTNELWGTGSVNPVPPTNITGGGPLGANDNYLQIRSIGGDFAPGGKPVIFNTVQWTGDYLAEGVALISFDVKNFDTEPLSIRFKLDGAGGTFTTKQSVEVPANSDWIHGEISLREDDLEGGGNALATLQNVNNLWLYHSDGTTFPGPAIVSTFGVDNIMAEGGAGGLPVEWLSFTAQPQDKQVRLDWQTASELQNAGFEIEMRAELPFEQFRSVGFVKGLGTSSEARSYQFLTPELGAGTYIFRLKQVDLNGAHSYSRVVKVTLVGEYEARLYPNPNAGQVHVQFQMANTERMRLKVYDFFGKQISNADLGRFKPGTHTHSWDMSGFAAGIYYCQLTWENGYTETLKLFLKP